jgi:REP-associated tyrosine transposase
VTGTRYRCSPTIWCFSPKYRGKVLVGDVAMLAEAIIRKTCKELDIEVIDMAVNPDHVHLFIKYPPKYSVSYISKMLKGRSSRVLRGVSPFEGMVQ